MYEVQVWFAHLPGLLNDLFEHAIPNDLGWMVSMKINRQVQPSIPRSLNLQIVRRRPLIGNGPELVGGDPTGMPNPSLMKFADGADSASTHW